MLDELFVADEVSTRRLTLRGVIVVENLRVRAAASKMQER